MLQSSRTLLGISGYGNNCVDESFIPPCLYHSISLWHLPLCLSFLSLLFHPSPSSLLSTLLTFSPPPSVCVSVLTVAIIKSCPVRYVAHSPYWCPFITHYPWVPVLMLTAYKLAGTCTVCMCSKHCCTQKLGPLLQPWRFWEMCRSPRFLVNAILT